MIVVCKNCKASFLVPDQEFARGPRTVKCARCQEVWREVPPGKVRKRSEPKSSPASAAPPQRETKPFAFKAGGDTHPASPAPAPSSPPPAPEPSEPWVYTGPSLKRLGALFFLSISIICLFLSLFAASFVVGHARIVEHFPELRPIYISMGIVETAYEGKLALENIHSERRYMDGAMRLVVEGKIVNRSDKIQVVPPLHVEAIGPSGHIIESWQIDAPKATIDKGMSVPFTSSVISPEGTAVELNLSFVDQTNDKN